MIVKAIYHGMVNVYLVFHNLMRRAYDPVLFQELYTWERPDDMLIIHGAYSANSLPDGLYLDCKPEEEPDEPADPVVDWVYPVQSGNVLTVKQVYKATLNGNVLEVE